VQPFNPLPKLFLDSVELPSEGGIGKSKVPVYVLGCFEARVTLFSQQVRALNLIYSLFDLRKLSRNSNLAIIGGGVSGITAAAGASFLGCRVTLIEQKTILHLFETNEERFIHPHIYDWPRLHSEENDANLPLLNWRAGRAADVTKQLKRAWEAIPKDNIEIFEGSTEVSLGNIAPGERPEVYWKSRTPNKKPFDAVILALGFGKEISIPGLPTPAYWEEDKIGQNNKARGVTKYLVSGCGDGGFVDLLRIRLQNFRHERIIQDFISKVNDKDGLNLKNELIDIEENAKASQDDGWLNEEYKKLHIPPELDNVIIASLRTDTTAVLNGPNEFPITHKACILNRLLVSRLLYYGTEYLAGDLKCGRHQGGSPGYVAIFSNGEEHDFDRVIVRHGTIPATDSLPEIAARARWLKGIDYRDATRWPIWPPVTFDLSSAAVGWKSFAFVSRKLLLQTAFRSLLENNPDAAELLQLCAWLGTAALPIDFFFNDTLKTDPPILSIATDIETLSKAIRDAADTALIQFDSDKKWLRIDLESQDVIKAEAENVQTGREWAEKAVRAVARVFPFPDDEHWETCKAYFPHVKVVVKAIETYEFDFDEAVRLLSDTAHYYYRMADYERAQTLTKIALSIRVKRFGLHHSIVAETIHSRGLYAHRLGRFDEAEALYLKALGIRQEILEIDRESNVEEFVAKNHEADIASSHNNLAWLYYFLGRYPQAKDKYEESLRIRKKVLAEDDPKLAMSLNNFARLSYAIGEYASAEEMYKESLSIRQKKLAPEHPDLAQSYNNLGLLYFKQGKYEEAKVHYEKSFEVYNHAHLAEHPDFAQTLNNLALLYLKQSKYDQAEAACWRARWISERVLGAKHPEVAHTLKLLGEWYLKKKKYTQAKAYAEQALRIREMNMGKDHPYVAQALNTLAEIFIAQKDFFQAESLAERGLRIRSNAFSINQNHPEIAESLNTLLKVYFRQRKYDLAQELISRVLGILEIAFNDHHPDFKVYARAYVPMLKRMNSPDVAARLEARIS
jgi:tetratricopeptide (TPR) repeat protein